MKPPLKISVIIISYNVREFLYQCLLSVYRATRDIEAEIFVVDNASVDGSVQMVKNHFPEVILNANKQNIGFAAANNQAIEHSQGEYIVLLNPDTIVQEDTFTRLLSFMDQTPEAGACTCKILNPDGSFSVDSRHSIPSPLTALWKLLGLNRIFPKSKIFGRYNLTYLDPDETYSVDAISGSFMLIRKKVVEMLGGLDEDYFMYCEDIDYCYRITQDNWKIYYVPETNIIHYKGESTKKNNIDYVINFNRSLYIFYKKHFHSNYLSFFRWVILLGVFFRGVIVFFRNFITSNFAFLADLIILNIIFFVAFVIRFELKSQFTFDDFVNRYIVINALSSIFFFGTAYFLELYGKYKLSIVQVFKTNIITFFILSAITFFFNQIAYSRLVVLIAAGMSIISMIAWRLVLRMLGSKSGNTFSKSFFQRRTIVVGTEKEAGDLVRKIKSQIQSDIILIGIISESSDEIGREIEGVPVVANLDDMNEFIRLEKIDEVIFSTHNLPYKSIIGAISAVKNPRIEYKIVSENLEVIIGKSSIEQISEYQLVELEYPLVKSFNRFTKRMFDIIMASGLFGATIFIWIVFPFLPGRLKKKYHLTGIDHTKFAVVQWSKPLNYGIINKILLLPYIITGKLSFVGAPLCEAESGVGQYIFKPGITGLWNINIDSESDMRNWSIYETYYAKNQSLWLDLEIIIKSIFQ